MITISQKGDFNKTTGFLNHLQNIRIRNFLEPYAKRGVEALKVTTPKNTGYTSESWYYDIIVKDGKASVIWNNRNVVDGVNIAIILQYGHASKSGSFVEGSDYINPALKSIMKEMSDAFWKEVTKDA